MIKSEGALTVARLVEEQHTAVRPAHRTRACEPEPPPISAATELVWCGATKGGTVISGASGASKPATECTAVTSRDRQFGSYGELTVR